MTSIKKKRATDTDDRGLPAWKFGALMLGAFTSVAGCALVGGWVGLIGIAATAVVLIGFAASRL